ncbi:MAG: helix-turn-helix transcriptional regulator [Paracoccaceae bacterium]|jgi:DNA-binding CsgD family transcriptional regulator|nr:helix-turn-helix transcriptional regulator [Paracoccaceae bacterium]MDP7186476.1 helix-turn-helix transcriptional regulator [Paracoccaceae bacterium]
MMSKQPRAVLIGLYVLLALQLTGTVIFVGELWSEVLGLRAWTVPFEWQEAIQIFASIALVLGTIAGIGFMRFSQAAMRRMATQIEAVSGQFHDHVRKQFAQWGFSRSEEAVAIYAMKGFSNAEIAEFRGTTAATVKSQMNAVYRKAGLSNRQQLISFLVEELLDNVSETAD